MSRISVVIPAYNRPDTLQIALQSARAQTRPADEIIVVDDGALPAVRDVAADFGATYISQTRGGVARARNQGIAHASGDLIALLDDDDAWPVDKLAWQESVLRQNPDAALVCGGVETVDARYGFADDAGTSDAVPLVVPAPDAPLWNGLVRKNPILSPGQTLIRRDALLSLREPPFDAAIWGSDDWDLWIRLVERYSFVWDSRISLKYRLHDANASRDLVRMFRGTFALLHKHQRRQRNDPARLATLTEARIVVETVLIQTSWGEPARQIAENSTRRTSFLWEMLRFGAAFPRLGLRKIGYVAQNRLRRQKRAGAV